MLLNHKFQLISFCSVYHPTKAGGNICVNDDSHIIHVLKGSGTVIIENEEQKLTRGTVIAIPPGVEFILYINPDFKMLNIHYNFWLSNDRMLDSVVRLPYVFKPGYFLNAEELLTQMELLSKSDKSLKIDPLAHDLVLNHITSNKLIPKQNKSFIDRKMMLIYKRLQSPDYNKYYALELGEYCALSVSQMNRNFKRVFKISPMRFWEKHRFVNVCLELKNYNNSISRISDIFGFEDQAYFSRWFKKMAGLPPAEYRKQIEQNVF